MIAFWKYDQFPFVLSGRVSHDRNDGSVFIDSYRMFVRPSVVLTDTEGEKVVEKLEALADEYRAAIKAVDKNFKEQLSNIAPFAMDKQK